MADNVKVELELVGIDNASMSVDKASDALNEYADSADKAGKKSSESAEKSKYSWTEFRSAYSTILEVVRIGNQIWQETTGAVVNLANEVRQFSDLTGATAEESSRLVDVLGHYKIQTASAEAATKKLTQDGFQFNIETLAKLSDEYNSLNSEQEKTQFLFDRFGRSGIDFAEIMRSGADAIREMNDTVPEQLILTQRQLDAARKYEIALDELKDSIDGLKVSIGNGLIPIGNDLLQVIKAQVDEGFKWQDAIAPLAFIDNLKKLKEAMSDNVTVSMEADTARWDGLASLYKTNELIQESTVSIEELSKMNESYLSTLGTVTDRIDAYTAKQEDLQDEEAKLLEEKDKLISQGWREESSAVQSINEKLDENARKQEENAAAFDKATKERMLSMLEEQLAVDGLDARETEFLLNQGLEWGLYSQTAIDEMNKAQDKVDELIGIYNSVPSVIGTKFVLTMEGQEALNIQRTGEKDYVPRRQNASGGTYMIPYSWGNERFPIGTSDTASGGELITISPAGGDKSNKELVSAILSTRINYDTLARAVVTAVQRGAK